MMSTTEPNAPHARQPRERAVPCIRCGIDHHGQPRTWTMNVSADCDYHEARGAAIDKLMAEGYSRQIAGQIVDRATPGQRAHR